MADSIRKHVNGVPAENIIVEPEGKNTAPCIGLAALHIAKRKKNSIMGVFPADHLIVGHKNLSLRISYICMIFCAGNVKAALQFLSIFFSVNYNKVIFSECF